METNTAEELARIRALIDARRSAEALRIATDLAAMEPNNASVHHIRGIALFRLRRWGEAGEAFYRSSSLDPDHFESHYYVGLCSERLGDVHQAANWYRYASAVRPDFRLAHEKLSSLGEGGNAATPPKGAESASPWSLAGIQRNSVFRRQSRLTDFTIPETAEELAAYKEWKRDKARIDFWITWYHRFPWFIRWPLGLLWLLLVVAEVVAFAALLAYLVDALSGP